MMGIRGVAVLAAVACGTCACLAADAVEKYLTEPIPDCPDETYLEFSRTGNRTHYQAPYGWRLAALERLTDVELAEKKGRCLPRLGELVDAICAERTWVMPAHDQELANFNGKGVYIDLGSGMRAAAIARCLRFHGAKLPAGTAARADRELRRRVFDPYLRLVRGERLEGAVARGSWWFRTGNNWNAVCHSCVVRAAIDRGIPERDAIIAAALAAAPFFRDGFTDDGYCSEGMGYWNYGFGYYVRMGLAVRKATGGRVDFFADPKWRKVMAYGYGFLLDAKTSPYFADGGGNPDPKLIEMGREVWPDLVGGKLPLRTLFPDAQVCIMRSADGGSALSVACKGGHNDEFHNHNDLGSFALMVDGRVVAGDPGGEEYTQRTFSSRRYESKVLSSYAHPVPVVGGRLQGTGRKFAAKTVRRAFADGRDEIAFDLTAGYDVPALKRLVRTFVLDRSAETVTIRDEFEFSAPTDVQEVWSAHEQDADRQPRTVGKPAGAWAERGVRETVENPGRPGVCRTVWTTSAPIRKAAFEFRVAAGDFR